MLAKIHSSNGWAKWEVIDCNDQDAKKHPNTNWYPDSDGDGTGDASGTVKVQCEQPPLYVLQSGDCNDTNPDLHPLTLWYADTNGDGLGDSYLDYKIQCAQPEGYVLELEQVQPLPDTPQPVYPNLDINDLSYTLSTQPLVEVQHVDSLNHLAANKKISGKTIYDGLGRPIQQIAIRQGGNRQDIISYTEYDGYGRSPKQYKAFTRQNGNAGTFETDAKQKSSLFIKLPAFITVLQPPIPPIAKVFTSAIRETACCGRRHRVQHGI